MNSERFARVMAILAEAYELPLEAQEAHLRERCGDDAELLSEALSLLAADRRSGRTLDDLEPSTGAILDAFGDAADDDEPELSLPDFIGNYRVLRLIARGGMGAVYEAEQDTPQRRVALKMLRTELVTRTLLKRFRRESEILGRLQHAGIAQVFEAGIVLDAGSEQPFFAMEFVDGRPLTAHAVEHKLDRDARLALFARVCDAVDHAHGKGVVHRDLKPDNILVTPDGQPKVLDFGVARSTAFDLSAVTQHTEAGQIIGTLAYMSPEQVRGDPTQVDARADVYALGVMLYELLAGERPFDVTRRSITEIVRVIEHQEAARLGKHDTALRGDLETIVGTALEKDRTRRYADAGALAADVRAHLRFEPIAARPPSAAYRARKFARRHRGLVAGTSVGMLALLVGLVIAVRFGVDEARQRAASERITYQTVLESATSLLAQEQPLAADRRLASAPEALRGWEWEHLAARVRGTSWEAVVDVELALEDAHMAHLQPGNRPLNFAAQGLAFSSDGARLLSPIDTRSLGVWDAATGELLARHDVGTELWPECLAVSDTRVALAAADGRLLILDLATGVPLFERAFAGQVRTASWSADGTRLAVGVQLPRVDDLLQHEVWLGTPEALAARSTGSGVVRRVSWFDGERKLAVLHDEASVDFVNANRVYVMSAEGGTLLRSEFLDIPKASSLTAHAESASLLIGTIARTVVQLDLNSELGETVFRGHVHKAVLDLALDAEGRRAVSVDGNSLRVWSVNGGEQLRAWHLGESTLRASCAIDPSGERVAVAHPDRLRVWTLADPGARVLRGHSTYVYWLDLSRDGRTLLSYDHANEARVWDLSSGGELARFAPHPQQPVRPWHMTYMAVGLSPDDTRMAYMGSHGAASVDLVAGRALSGTLDTAPSKDPPSTDAELHARELSWRDTMGGRRSTQHRVFSPDGRLMLDVLNRRLIDATSGARRAALQGLPSRSLNPQEAIGTSASFAPEGDRFAFARLDATIHDAHSGALLYTLPAQHEGWVYAVAWSPDGTRLATGGQDGAVVIWDTQSWEPLLRLAEHDQYVFDLLWTPDGRSLVSSSGDGTVRVWDSVPRTELSARARAERSSQRAQTPRVQALFTQLDDPQAVADALRNDPELDDEQRFAALRAARELASAWWERAESEER